MTLILDVRASTSPLVEQIWHARSRQAGSFVSVAASHWEIVVTKHDERRRTLTVRGPATQPQLLAYPEGKEWCGIRFPLSAMTPQFPISRLVDRAFDLPGTGRHSFWLNGSMWSLPEFENADTFVERLVRDGLLIRDPVVDAFLQGHPTNVSVRTEQRRVLNATGLTQSTIRQIERARHAMSLLQRGVSILDTIYEAGYYDQSHLTRSLKHWLGQTPSQITGADYPE